MYIIQEKTMTHGGARAGAGRPKTKEPTKAIRLPESKIPEILQWISQGAVGYSIPLYSSTVRAGFPSPAEDYIEAHLDLNQYLIAHPAATFLVRASGDSMIQAGIHSGDILIVDRSLQPAHGHIIIAAINGELTVKRLARKNGRVQLIAENPNYPPLDITEEQEVVIWGVVKHVIHTVS